MNNWHEKYKPKKSEDIVGHSIPINELSTWLSNFNKPNVPSCAIVIGTHGIGKSTAINLTIHKNNYIPCTININELKTAKSIYKYIEAFLDSNCISNMFKNNVKTKKLLILDEIEYITAPIDKNSIINLHKENEKYKWIPIIFISNNKHNKILSEIKKTCKEIEFKKLSISDMYKIVSNIIKYEKMKIDDDIIYEMISYSQNDIRRLITICNELYNIYKHDIITVEKYNDYLITSKPKDLDIGLFESTNALMTNRLSIAESVNLYESEKVLLPLMIHENYISMITNDKINNKQKLKYLSLISESLSIGDMIDNQIYSNQDWEMQEIHGIHSCAIPSYYLNCYTNRYNKFYKYVFPTDLNRTSIKNINKKNISNIEIKFCYKSIYDYINIIHIVQYLIQHDKYKECMELLKSYGVTIETIESLLKINKISTDEPKFCLSNRQKKELLKFF